MTDDLSRLEVKVRINPADPNQPSLRVLVDDKELVTDGEFIGFDPEYLLTDSSPLLATDEPRRVAVYHCSCGEPGCGSVVPLISREGDVVKWSDFRDYVGVYNRPTDDPHPDESWGKRMALRDLQFDAAQYESAIREASADRTWETDARKVARRVREKLTERAEELQFKGFTFDWACPQEQDILRVSLREGQSQVVCEYRVPAETPEAAADSIVHALLSTDVAAWPVVFSNANKTES